MICQCGWKHNDSECPRCGKPADVDKRVASFNSTIRVDPGKRWRKTSVLKPVSRQRSNGKQLSQSMREYVLHRFPGYSGQSVKCDNCGGKIRTIKFENVSHTHSRSSRPGLAHDFDNMKILCGPMDFISAGLPDQSCHTLWEQNKVDEYNSRSTENHK